MAYTVRRRKGFNGLRLAARVNCKTALTCESIPGASII